MSHSYIYLALLLLLLCLRVKRNRDIIVLFFFFFFLLKCIWNLSTEVGNVNNYKLTISFACASWAILSILFSKLFQRTNAKFLYDFWLKIWNLFHFNGDTWNWISCSMFTSVALQWYTQLWWQQQNQPCIKAICKYTVTVSLPLGYHNDDGDVDDDGYNKNNPESQMKMRLKWMKMIMCVLRVYISINGKLLHSVIVLI